MYGNIPYMEHLCYISPTKVSLICCDPWSRGDLRFFCKKMVVWMCMSVGNGGIVGPGFGDEVV